MSPVWLSIAFVLGLLVKLVGLPPLIGFLAAGFALHALGVESTDSLEQVADYGVQLLLFTIGLKLRLHKLARMKVWGTTVLHMGTVVIVLAGIELVAGAMGLPFFVHLDQNSALLVAFAFSFSSTVFAVKVLEEKGEMASLHGRIAIGILVMQDIVAVLFLAASSGKLPSAWAVVLLGLVLVRPALFWLIERAGRGELLVLFGLLLPLAGGALFQALGVKPDLGALVFGVLLASHPKASELAKALLSFKDILLIGFFLTIGLSGPPSLAAVGIAVMMTLLVPIKSILFFLLFTRFRLRVRTSTLATFSLSNYSEFGLIVGAVGASNGWISSDWLVIAALALAMSFVLAAPINQNCHSLYKRWKPFLIRFQTEKRLRDDGYVSPGDAEIVVFGVGRVGTGVYDSLRHRFGRRVIGIDFDEDVVTRHREAGRQIIHGDATDADFWDRIQPSSQVSWAVLAMSDHAANLEVVQRAVEYSSTVNVAAIAKFPDEVEALKAAGVKAVFNFYAEAGSGFADHLCDTVLAPTQGP